MVKKKTVRIEVHESWVRVIEFCSQQMPYGVLREVEIVNGLPSNFKYDPIVTVGREITTENQVF